MIRPLSPEQRIFVLTGAGISAESGLPTFRGAGGIWRGYRAQDVATPEAFRADPQMVWQFYSERRKRHSTVMANRAHFALASLEQALGDRFFLCTQNVDSLHEQAGTKRIIHMHGRLIQTRCSREGSAPNPSTTIDMYTSYIRDSELPSSVAQSHAPPRLLVWRNTLLHGPASSSSFASAMWY